MLAWILNLGFGAGGSQQPPPPPPPDVPVVLGGSGQRRRGSIWEPSVVFAIAAAQEERRLARAAEEAKAPRHPSARPAVHRHAELFNRIEAVQLAIKRTHSARVKQVLRVIEEEEQTKLAALAREDLEAATGFVRGVKAAREELEAAQAMLLIMARGRRESIGDEEAAAILMNMLMNVKH